MNYTLDDRHRSLRRFLMNALGSPPWRLRTERQPVADEQRPVGVVEPVAAAVTTRARVTVPQGDVEKAQTFSIMLYPELADTAGESRLAAAEVAQLLDDAFTSGLIEDDGSELSRPFRVPVYDFAGVAVKGALRVGPGVPYGWLWIEDAPVRVVQDPDDVLRFAVLCDARVSWSQGGRVRDPAEPPVGDFTGTWAGDGSGP
jgi:hypothetical protein